MSLIFHDEQIKCPECGSNLFKEDVIYTLIEKQDRFNGKYYEKDSEKHNIYCANCSTIISSTKKSILREKGE